MGIMYYGMPSEEECKAAALKFSVTRDPSLFKLFLHRYEKLGLYICALMKQRNSWLRNVKEEDLEQTSYIGMYKAFEGVKANQTAHYIALRVISYVKHALDKTYHYLMAEQRYYKVVGQPMNIDDVLDDGPNEQLLQDETYTPTGSKDLEDYKKCPGITDREADVIQAISVDGRTLTEVAKEMGISIPRVHQVLRRIHEKLRKVIKKE